MYLIVIGLMADDLRRTVRVCAVAIRYSGRKSRVKGTLVISMTCQWSLQRKREELRHRATVTLALGSADELKGEKREARDQCIARARSRE